MSGIEILLKSLGIDVEALMKDAQEKGNAAIAHMESIAASLQILDARLTRIEAQLARLYNSTEFPSEGLAGQMFNSNPALWDATAERLTHDGKGFGYFGDSESGPEESPGEESPGEGGGEVARH